MNIPVVIFHIGYRDYLEFALKTAKKFNEDVILIGDKSNEKVWDNHCFADDLSSDSYERFLKVYIQLSDYTADYDLFLFQRFFCLREWMKRNNINKVFMLDSDVVT